MAISKYSRFQNTFDPGIQGPRTLNGFQDSFEDIEDCLEYELSDLLQVESDINSEEKILEDCKKNS